ncbi:MAG: hypothetical protein PHV13_05045 [Candidatus ainarchaeum sp.]|nr:hypothetical protein [Candidatus ainarchaeum sp.]
MVVGAQLEKPKEEAAGLRPAFQSELASLSQRYGLDLGRAETAQIIEKAAGNLKKTPPDVQERLEKALMSYIKSMDPARAYTLSNQMEGRKYWENLGVDNAGITLLGKKTTVGAALDACAAEADTNKRMGMFLGIACELAEKYRVGQDFKNSFGIKYDLMSTDPADIIREKTFNCFSSSIALGQMISYAAGRLGLQDDVKAKLQLVASWSKSGEVWDDMGHALLRLDVTTARGNAEVFFDPMNMVVARHEKELVHNKDENTLERPKDPLLGTRASGMSYRLSDAMALTPELVAKAQLQERLFSMESIGQETANAIARLPPVFIGYYANNLDRKQQKAFFANYGVERVGAIEHPAQRYQVAVLAATALSDTDLVAATEFGKIALSAMKEAVTGPRAELVRMPMGSYLKKTMNLISLMSQTDEGRLMVASSRAWVYLPYVINVATPESMEKGTAREARDFLAGFYLRNPKTIATEGKLNPWGLFICSSAIMKVNALVGATTESDNALDRLYAGIGINRAQLLLEFRAVAPKTVAYGVTSESVMTYMSSPASMRQFENAFLNQCGKMITKERQENGDIVIVNRFSLEQLRYQASTVQGDNAILGNALYRIFSDKAKLSVVMLPGMITNQMYAAGMLNKEKGITQKTAQK